MDYPSDYVYIKKFDSWNNALEIAGLPVNKVTNLANKPNICEICGTTQIFCWNYKDGLKICNKCYNRNRHYLHGILNPNSKTGMGVISEYIVAKVLDDCEKCNTPDDFCAPYDLVSISLGTINVKSSKLHINGRWVFSTHKRIVIPDNYACIGFNNDRTEILHV